MASIPEDGDEDVAQASPYAGVSLAERLRTTLRMLRLSASEPQFAQNDQLVSTLFARGHGIPDRDLLIARAYLVDNQLAKTHYSPRARGGRGTFCVNGWTLDRLIAGVTHDLDAIGEPIEEGPGQPPLGRRASSYACC